MLLVVLAAVEGVVEPLVGGLALGVGERLLRLQRIIDQDDVGPQSGQHAAIGGGEPAAMGGGQELLHGLAMRSQAGREDPPIPRAHHDAAAIAGELVREVPGIADAEDLRRRVVSQIPGRKGDRSQQRFEMARRQVDDQPPDLALADGGQLRRDHLEMPVHQERRLRVELAETALSEITEIRAQDRMIFGGRKVVHRGLFFLAPEPRPDPLDDQLVGLGESRWICRPGIGTRFNLAEHRQQDLNGFQIGFGRPIDQLGDVAEMGHRPRTLCSLC